MVELDERPSPALHPTLLSQSLCKAPTAEQWAFERNWERWLLSIWHQGKLWMQKEHIWNGWSTCGKDTLLQGNSRMGQRQGTKSTRLLFVFKIRAFKITLGLRAPSWVRGTDRNLPGTLLRNSMVVFFSRGLALQPETVIWCYQIN